MGIQTSLTADEIAKVALDSKADIIVVDQEHQLKKVEILNSFPRWFQNIFHVLM